MAETAEAVKENVEQKHGDAAPVQDAAQQDSKTPVQSVELSEAAGAETTGGGGSIDIILDMNIPLTVLIGTTEIPVRRLLQLGPGSVLKLDKPIEAPVDLYLEDSRFATGSVVVVDERFAVKIEQVLAAAAKPPES
jgi:flagellar motor switch protein FliN/FliY